MKIAKHICAEQMRRSFSLHCRLMSAILFRCLDYKISKVSKSVISSVKVASVAALAVCPSTIIVEEKLEFYPYPERSTFTHSVNSKVVANFYHSVIHTFRYFESSSNDIIVHFILIHYSKEIAIIRLNTKITHAIRSLAGNVFSDIYTFRVNYSVFM